jgi:hypothetical protein
MEGSFMAQTSTDDAYIAQRLDTVLAYALGEECYAALVELVQFLSLHPRKLAPDSSEHRYVVAIDTGNECLLELFGAFLPPELVSHTTLAAYRRLPDVIRMLQEQKPAVLAIHSNLLIPLGEIGIAACVAASPGTRYLIIKFTAWSVEEFHKLSEQIQSRIDVCLMPCKREEFAAAMRSIAKPGC